MTQKCENLAGCATGEALDCLATRLDEPKYSTSPIRIKDLIRASFLRRTHGLSGSRAVLIADLAFDGGRR